MKQFWIGTALLGAILVAAPALGYAQVANLEPYVDIGKTEYLGQCAVCHGESGKGDGSFNALLKKHAADLTVLSKNNGGVFPFDRTYAIISGAKEVAGHGPRNMPIWGQFLQEKARSELPASAGRVQIQSFVRARILALVEHLSTLQTK
jgi:mono/diheme cytochrome c family protein